VGSARGFLFCIFTTMNMRVEWAPQRSPWRLPGRAAPGGKSASVNSKRMAGPGWYLTIKHDLQAERVSHLSEQRFRVTLQTEIFPPAAR